MLLTMLGVFFPLFILGIEFDKMNEWLDWCFFVHIYFVKLDRSRCVDFYIWISIQIANAMSWWYVCENLYYDNFIIIISIFFNDSDFFAGQKLWKTSKKVLRNEDFLDNKNKAKKDQFLFQFIWWFQKENFFVLFGFVHIWYSYLFFLIFVWTSYNILSSFFHWNLPHSFHIIIPISSRFILFLSLCPNEIHFRINNHIHTQTINFFFFLFIFFLFQD